MCVCMWTRSPNKKKRSGRNRKWRAWVGIPHRGWLHGVMRRLPAPQQLPPNFHSVSPWPFSAFSTFKKVTERGGGTGLLPLRNRSETIASEKIKPKRDLHLKGLTPFFSSDFSTRGEKKGNKNFVCRDNTLPPHTPNREKRETLVRRTFFIRSVFLGDVHTFFSYLISRARLIATSYRLWPSNAEPLPSFLCSFRKRFQEDTSGTLFFFFFQFHGKEPMVPVWCRNDFSRYSIRSFLR